MIDDEMCGYGNCENPAAHKIGVIDLYLCEDHYPLRCSTCGEEFDPDDFESIDDEFNENKPQCPECQEQEDLKDKECEYCENPAVASPASGVYLCEEHYANYVNGYISKD